MPLPLKPGYNFNLDHQIRPPYYEMAAAENYTDYYGISFMISGERLIYSPNFTAVIQSGELSFIPKHVYRRTTYISSAPYERILIKFTDSMLTELIDTIGKDTFDELCNEHILRFSEETLKKIHSIFNEMEQEWNMYNEYSELILKGLLNKLIITCLRERSITNTNTLNLQKRNGYLSDAVKYIKANLHGNLSLEATAQIINISPSYLSKIFATYLHTPFSTFVQNERIAYAQKLLTETNLSIIEIASKAGFSSNAYFSDCFKRTTGLSPLRFRKQNK